MALNGINFYEKLENRHLPKVSSRKNKKYLSTQGH